MKNERADVTTRISAEALRFCQINQQAYEAGLIALKKMVKLADLAEKEQTGFVNEAVMNPNGGKQFTTYFDGNGFSASHLTSLMEKEHKNLVANIVSFLQSAYDVNLDAYKIQCALIPEDPRKGVRCGKEDVEAWKGAILNLRLNYQDILRQVFVQTEDKDLAEKSMEEMLYACTNAAINDRTQQKMYTIKNGTIAFKDSCYPDQRYLKACNKPRFTIPDNMKAVMKAANMFAFDVGPADPLYYPFNELSGYTINEARFYASDDMGRLKEVRLYQNGRLDLTFVTAELAKEFAVKYLGEPA